MDKNFLFIFIRYLSLLMVFLDTLGSNSNVSNLIIITLFLIIVNNQIRFFNFSHNKFSSIFSIILEFILFIILSNSLSKFSVLWLIPIILDISFLTSSKIKYCFIFIIIAYSFIINIPFSFYIALQSSCILLICSILFIYIYEESLIKLNNQHLFDKLRISEDKLKKANSDLELYASSIEEVAVLKERNRIAREIHDSVGHSLSTTIIQLGAIEKLLKGNDDLESLVHELREFVKESFAEVRKSVSSLKPCEYENYQNLFKIEELINNFIKLTNVDVKLTISKNTWALSSIQSLCIYRVIQEALSNALRHGKADKIKIFISFTPKNLTLTINDNGVGCSNITMGNGLKSIRERISEINGKSEFINSSDGFIIRASFKRYTGGEFIEQN